MRNFKFIYVVALAITLGSVLTSCNKNNALYGGEFDMTASATLDGTNLNIVGVSDIDFSKSEFTAEIEITTIDGVAEAHTITLNGTMDEPGFLVITDETFTIERGGVSQTVTVNGEIIANSLTYMGDGTLSVVTSTGTVTGSFYVDGLKN